MVVPGNESEMVELGVLTRSYLTCVVRFSRTLTSSRVDSNPVTLPSISEGPVSHCHETGQARDYVLALIETGILGMYGPRICVTPQQTAVQ
ncbi:hypothetical protein ACLOJK_012603 [Asimina triloba]